jgi:hypothetical protein
VFGSHGLTRAVQVAFLGARNPYAWDEHAIRCAVLRRRILAALVPLWTGGRVAVATAHGFAWNAGARAFEMTAAFCPGRPLPLSHPLRRDGPEVQRRFRATVLEPLQRRLATSGFDGLLWQAGLGNPVAWNNFLREEVDGRERWTWIDLESGVPALFPASPLALLRTYLPLAVRLGRVPFDDVDAARVRGTIEEAREDLVARLGVRGYERLLDDADALGFHQACWKGRSRLARSLGAALAAGDVTEAEARRYVGRPAAWTARLLGGALRKAARKALRLVPAVLRRLSAFPWRRRLVGVARFLASERFREEVAHGMVRGRIDAWERRGQLDPAHVQALRAGVADEEAGAWLTDFAVHLALKPPTKAFQLWVAPLLFAAGWIDAATLAAVLLLAGSVARTAYTLWRLSVAAARGRPLPWVALGVGVLPVVGTAAFPLQIAWSGAEGSSRVAAFLLHDAAAALGRSIPVWGGADTATEHRLNDLVRWIGGRQQPSA